MTHANVVAEVAKIGPQWVDRHIAALLSGAAERTALLAQCEVFDDEERLASAESVTKDKRERDMLDSLKLSLSQSAVEPLEVTEVRRGYGLSLRGALTGRRFYVDSAEVAGELEPMEWLIGRVIVFGQKAYLLEDWRRVPFRRRKQLRAALLSDYQPEGESPEGETQVPTTWLKERGPWVISTHQEVTST